MTKKSVLIMGLFYPVMLLANPTFPDSKTLNVKVILEGAFNSGTGLMSTALQSGSLIPNTQPFGSAPWNYPGTETVVSVPPGVVDWVLVELRDAATPEQASQVTNLPGWPRALFLKADGSLVTLDGTSLPDIGSPPVTSSLFIVVRHRNHLAVISSTGASLAGDVYSYDFTSGISQAFGGATGCKMVGTKAVMVVGDIDHDKSIFVSDYNKWATGFGTANTYNNADLDMDRNVYVSDFNKWATNFGSRASIVDDDGTIKDSRDNHIYKTVTINGQVWMAENLAYLPSVVTSATGSETLPYYYVYGYEGTDVSAARATSNYGTYGVLYNWVAATGACPPGWHLPTHEEWILLTDYLTNNGFGYGGSGSDIGKSLASKTGWTADPTAGNVGNQQDLNNTSGFSILPGGLRQDMSGFDYLGSLAFLWTSSLFAPLESWYRDLYYNNNELYRNHNTVKYGFSVRCLKNTP